MTANHSLVDELIAEDEALSERVHAWLDAKRHCCADTVIFQTVQGLARHHRWHSAARLLEMLGIPWGDP